MANAMQPVSVSFSALPKPLQLYPRNLNTNEATIFITGEVISSGLDEIIVRVYRDAVLIDTLTQQLTYNSGLAPFSLSPTITAEMMNYSFEVYVKDGPTETLVRSVADVVAGDVYLINGQSNAVASDQFGETPSVVHQSPFIRSFGRRDTTDNVAQILADTNWHLAKGDMAKGPGEIGQWGLLMARRLLDDYGIPIAIINAAQGGKKMPFFQRNDANPDDTQTNYGIMLWRAQQAEVVDGVRAIFWYQGEADGDDVAGHQSGFADLHADWHTDFPNVERIFVHQVRFGCGLPTVELRDAQRRFGDNYSDVRVMSTTGIDAHDGCHYPYDDGHETVGEHIYPLVARELYGAPNTSSIDPPNIDYAYFSNGANTQITIHLRDPDDALTWQPGIESDLRLEASAVSIVGGAVNGNTLVLTLSGNGSAATGITYDSPLGDGDWVLNENGIGMLDFFNIPIGDMPPTATPTETFTPTPVHTFTPTATPTQTPSPTATATPTAAHGSVGDCVWIDQDADGRAETSEFGIAGVTVQIYDSDGNIMATSVTGENGAYLLTDIPTGDHVVRVDTKTLPANVIPTHDRDGTLDHKTPVKVMPDQTWHDVDFGYQYGAKYAEKASLNENEPCPDAVQNMFSLFLPLTRR